MNGMAKRALVTGGSGGIGAAICRQLGRTGHFVYVHANRNRAAADAVVADITAAGGAAEAVCFDVTDGSGTRAILETLIERAPVQILVNNAGIHEDAAFPGMSSAQWSRVVDVSINGFYNVTQPIMLPMIRTRWGRIINISSVTALAGNRGQVNYAAAKGALNIYLQGVRSRLYASGVAVTTLKLGGRTFRLIVSPIFDAAAKRTGTVVDWRDLTPADLFPSEPIHRSPDTAAIA